MPRPFPLTAVLRLREQREHTEERALLALNADLEQVRLAIARVESEAARFTSLRQGAVQKVLTAAHHQLLALEWRSLQEALAQLRNRSVVLEKSRTEQQERLLTARTAREALSEVHSQYKLGLQQEATRSERKGIDEIFSARNGRLALEARNQSLQKLKKFNPPVDPNAQSREPASF